MSDNNRVKSTHITATAQVSPSTVPAHVIAWHIVAGASAGSIVLTDGGAGGATVATIDMPAGVTIVSDGHLPQLGMRFGKDCFATLTNITSATFFWY